MSCLTQPLEIPHHSSYAVSLLQGKSAKIVYLNDAGERVGDPMTVVTEGSLPQLIAAQLGDSKYGVSFGCPVSELIPDQLEVFYTLISSTQ